MKNPCAKPTSFDTFTDDHWFITHTIKDCMLFAAINKYRFTMEKRADEEAASTKELAEAGVQIYTNIKHLIVDQKPGLAFLERNTWLKSPSYAERIEYLEARVHDFAVEEALEHFYASRAAHMTDEGDDCAEEAEAL
jgi:hypothetical protein